MSNIFVNLISQFQSKGFKDAEKQTGILEKSFKRLAVTLGTALSVRKITQFSKASIKAFVEEDKAVQALATNLSNLGLAYDVRPVEKYIRELQYATGVADGELRPALQQLVTSTKDLAISQELLALSLDIAAGTGKSLSSVTQALGRAYLGTNTSLTRLNIGLSKADLTTKSFNQITEELTDRFSGQAARAAGTYAGQLAVLSAAAGDAQEILGEKLVKSVELLLDEDQGVPALAKSFEDMATYVGNVSVGLASIVSLYKKIPTFGDSTGSSFAQSVISTLLPGVPGGIRGLNALQRIGATSTAKAQAKSDAIARANSKEQGMLRSRNLVTEKKITAEKLKQNKAQAESNKLTKAGKLFDDELISLDAALKNAELDENEILRLKLKKALVLENADQAEKLAKKLSDSQDELARLAQFKPANPFQEWLDSLEAINKSLGSLGVQVAPSAPGGAVTQSPIIPPSFVPQGQSGYIPPSITQEDLFDAFGRGSGVMAPTINVTVQGTGDLSDDTKQKVVDTIVEASRSGFSTGWYSTTARVAL
jgi:hypothetical protein